jgi:hypothetical protein
MLRQERCLCVLAAADTNSLEVCLPARARFSSVTMMLVLLPLPLLTTTPTAVLSTAGPAVSRLRPVNLC